MAAPGDVYERELKALLSGEEKAVNRMVKTCDIAEATAYRSMMDRPFLVIRAAGSLGVDLVALRWDFSFPIEVKSSEKDVLYLSRSERLVEQAETMIETCNRSHIIPIYAYRRKNVRGDPWRLFTMPSDASLCGTAAMLRGKIPYVEVSRGGNYILRWSNGIKLSELLEFVDTTQFVSDDSELLPYEEDAAAFEEEN
jgi:Holliday junction resolvase